MVWKRARGSLLLEQLGEIFDALVDIGRLGSQGKDLLVPEALCHLSKRRVIGAESADRY